MLLDLLILFFGQNPPKKMPQLYKNNSENYFRENVFKRIGQALLVPLMHVVIDIFFSIHAMYVGKKTFHEIFHRKNKYFFTITNIS